MAEFMYVYISTNKMKTKHETETRKKCSLCLRTVYVYQHSTIYTIKMHYNLRENTNAIYDEAKLIVAIGRGYRNKVGFKKNLTAKL